MALNLGSAFQNLKGLGGRIRQLNANRPMQPISYGQRQVSPRINFPSFMPKGASMTPAGDIGERRQREAVAVGGFKDGETVRASNIFNTFRGGK